MKKLTRYLKIYKVLLKLNLVKLFAYRANFFSSLTAHTVWASFVLISMMLLTSQSSTIYGWTRDELLIMAGTYNLLFSIFYFFFSRNFGEFSNTIHFGRLDAILTKPVDSQFMMTCTYVGYTHIVRFLMAVIFLAIIIPRMHVLITPLTLLWFMVFVFLSIITMYSIWFSVMTLTIWFSKLSNLTDLLYETQNVSKYPQEIYKGANMYLFYMLFPLTLIVVMPTKALLHKMLLGDIFWPFLFAIGLFILSRKFWKFALRSYTSASG